MTIHIDLALDPLRGPIAEARANEQEQRDDPDPPIVLQLPLRHMSQPTSQISTDTAAEEIKRRIISHLLLRNKRTIICGSAYLRDPHIADERTDAQPDFFVRILKNGVSTSMFLKMPPSFCSSTATSPTNALDTT